MLKFLIEILNMLRPAFKRQSTFNNFCDIVLAMAVRKDQFGVTSLVRTISDKAGTSTYKRLLHTFESGAVLLEKLSRLWTQLVAKVFNLLEVEGRKLFVTDTKVIPKEGMKMPGGQYQHQSSNNVKKAEFTYGHNMSSTGALVNDPNNPEHPGYVGLREHLALGVDELRSNLPKNELIQSDGNILEQAAADYRAVCEELDEDEKKALAADAYYAKKPMVEAVLDIPNAALITRMRHDTVGFKDPEPKPAGRRGPQKMVGDKVKLEDQFDNDEIPWQEATISLYGEERKVRYKEFDLFWNRKERFPMRFVLVEMLDKDGLRATSRMILGCTDRDISSIGIITIYSYRMKIELSFRDRNQHIGLEDYHFWSASQPERQSKQSDKAASSAEDLEKDDLQRVSKCLKRIESHLMFCTIAHGLLQLVAFLLSQAGVSEKDIVWKRTYSENSISIWVAQQYLSGILFCSQGERGDPKLQSLAGLTLERPREVEQAPKNGV